MAQVSLAGQTVLAVLPAGEDRAALRQILMGSEYVVHEVGTVAEARVALRGSGIDVVISESRFPNGECWSDLLPAIQNLTSPPPLIVADGLADERLWAEVLNLGAHDLLAKPFDPKELRYAAGMACRCRAGKEAFRAASDSAPRNDASADEALAAIGAGA